MDKKRAFRIAVLCIGVVLCCLFVFLVLPRLIVWFLPFVLAYFLSKIIEPIVRFLERKCKIPRKVGSVFGIILAVGTLGSLIFVLVNRLVAEANDIVAKSDIIIGEIQRRYEGLRNLLANRFGMVDILDTWVTDLGNKLSGYAASYTVPALQGAFDVVKAIPSAIIFTVVFLLATFFMSSDRTRISDALHRSMPGGIMRFIDRLMKNVFSALGAYIRAQLILICITFFELSIGFLAIGGKIANYALLLALIISIIDAIPILGTGAVLIPWGVFSLLSGDIRLGVMLIILYLICLLVRQLTEPRLVAHRIGIHPLPILMVMYIGLRFFGLFGMILGPVLALLFKQLYTDGLFRRMGNYINGRETKEGDE